jgi:DNA-directed RNA polymerase II subunit RPB2
MEFELDLTKEAKLFKRFLQQFGIKRNIVQTYNAWIKDGLIRQFNDRLKFLRPGTFEIVNLTMSKPKLSLRDCRNKQDKYSGTVIARVKYTSPSDVVSTKDITLGDIPVMLASTHCHLYDKEKSEQQGFPCAIPADKLISLDECPNDPFGYFFVKGEKTIIVQEKLRVCSFLTYAADNKGTVESRITCVNTVSSTIVTIGIDAKIGSLGVALNHLKKPKKYPIFLVFKVLGVEPVIAEELILSFIPEEHRTKATIRLVSSREEYRLTERDICAKIAKVTQVEGCNTPDQRDKMLKKIIDDLYTHIDPKEYKTVTLAFHISRLLQHLIGERKLDSRDDWGHKRLDSSGRCMEQLVTGMWHKVVDKASGELTTATTDPLDKFSQCVTNFLTDEFVSAFGNNSWGLKGGRSKENIVEQLRRDTPMAVISQIGRVNTPVSRRGQMRNIREITGGQLGFLCTFETPEGEGCGINKNIALTCWPSIERPVRDVTNIIVYSEYYDSPKPEGTTIFEYARARTTANKFPDVCMINGVIYGWCDGSKLRDLLRNHRRNGTLDFDICIYYNAKDHCLEIDTLGSRPTRPLLVINKFDLVIDTIPDGWSLSIQELRRLGCIENIDAREQHDYYISYSIDECRKRRDQYNELNAALVEQGLDIRVVMGAKNNKERDELSLLLKDIPNRQQINESIIKVDEWWNDDVFDYCELDPNAQFSLTASHIPGANQQQGPRTTYQCSMGKQALSQYHTCEGSRMDTSSKILVSPTRPIVEVETAELLGLNRMPSGESLIVAIMAHPDNPEDGIVMTKEASIMCNFLTICKKTTHTIVLRKGDVYRRPETREGEKSGKYHAIEPDGMPKLDTFLGKGDCLLGRVFNNTDTGKYENNSVFIGIGEEGYVDRITNHGDTLKIKLRQYRAYKAGDKMASRYAQKGTVAAIVDKETMPRVCETLTDASGAVRHSPNAGLVPDILINPHSFPSRMTMNKMNEMLVSKAALFSGERVNGTTFRPIDIEHFKQVLKDNDMREDGSEDMEIQTYYTDRETREKKYTGKWRRLRRPIMVGVCYYQALKHHVDDKLQYRSRGAIRTMTHQPVRGRSREGGIRFGEMERDAQISHAAAAILQERLCISSDQFTITVCVECGRLCIADYSKNTTVKYSCKNCPTNVKNFGMVKIPYAFKLIMYMLQACCMDVRLGLELQK